MWYFIIVLFILGLIFTFIDLPPRMWSLRHRIYKKIRSIFKKDE